MVVNCWHDKALAPVFQQELGENMSTSCFRFSIFSRFIFGCKNLQLRWSLKKADVSNISSQLWSIGLAQSDTPYQPIRWVGMYFWNESHSPVMSRSILVLDQNQISFPEISVRLVPFSLFLQQGDVLWRKSSPKLVNMPLRGPVALLQGICLMIYDIVLVP